MKQLKILGFALAAAFGVSQAQAEDLTGTLKNIKDTGVTIYAIQVNTGGDPQSALLQNCATDSSKFFLLTSSTQIVTTFQQIGTNLAKLHIAK